MSDIRKFGVEIGEGALTDLKRRLATSEAPKPTSLESGTTPHIANWTSLSPQSYPVVLVGDEMREPRSSPPE